MQTITNEPTVAADMRTVPDFHKHGYSGIDHGLMKDILYLEQLSTTTSQPISKWPVVEMLKKVKRGDKRGINKLFFDHIETDKKEAISPLDSETFTRIEKALFDAHQKRHDELVASCNYRYHEALNTARDFAKRLDEKVKAARGRFDELKAIEGSNASDVVQRFRRVVENPFWTFEKFTRNTAIFITSNDIIMTYKNDAAGIDRTINFGRIRIILDCSRASIQAAPAENNLVTPGGYYHTFISCGGDICFGTAEQAVRSLLIEYKYDEVFSILASLLVNYDGGSTPWMSFQTFMALDDQNKRLTQEKCKECGLPDNHCICPYCECCRKNGDHATHECENYCVNCGSYDKANCGCETDDEEEQETEVEEEPEGEDVF